MIAGLTVGVSDCFWYRPQVHPGYPGLKDRKTVVVFAVVSIDHQSVRPVFTDCLVVCFRPIILLRTRCRRNIQCFINSLRS